MLSKLSFHVMQHLGSNGNKQNWSTFQRFIEFIKHILINKFSCEFSLLYEILFQKCDKLRAGASKPRVYKNMFLSIKFYWNTTMPIYMLSMVALHYNGRGWVVATKTIWPVSLWYYRLFFYRKSFPIVGNNHLCFRITPFCKKTNIIFEIALHSIFWKKYRKALKKTPTSIFLLLKMNYCCEPAQKWKACFLFCFDFLRKITIWVKIIYDLLI